MISGAQLFISLLILSCGAHSVFAETDLRDPTRPITYSIVEGEEINRGMKLHSVLISSQRKVAVINGKTVKENEWVGDAKIIRISPGLVVIEHQGERQQLTLRNPIRTKSKEQRLTHK